MKFRYIGELPIKDVDLVIAGIFTPQQTITKNTEFEVPDTDALLIQRIKINGTYEEVPQKVEKPKTFKKSKQKKDKEEK